MTTDGGGVAAQDIELTLREPAHRVSPRAVSYWRLTEVLTSLFVDGGLVIAWFVWSSRPWWFTVIVVLALVLTVVELLVVPPLRYRIHRWEVTDEAVFTRTGWLSREHRIAPLSRVQTVDSEQGALMRLFGLSSITVTTASAAGPITIACLDTDVAQRTLAELTAITAATRGDAT